MKELTRKLWMEHSKIRTLVNKISEGICNIDDKINILNNIENGEEYSRAFLELKDLINS